VTPDDGAAIAATPSGNVAALLAAAAGRDPGRPAVVELGGRIRWRFGSLSLAAAGVAELLERVGVRRGDLVVVAVADPGAALAVVAGILWAGGVVVTPTVGWRAVSARTGAGPRARAIVLGRAGGVVAVGRRGRVGWRRLPGSRVPAGMMPAPPRDVDPAAPAIVTRTTGTTGRPRLVVRTHGDLRAQHSAIATLRVPGLDDVDLAGTPLLVLHDLAIGVTSVLPPGRRDRDRAPAPAAPAALERVTTIAGFPSLAEWLLRLPGADLGRVRSIHLGGDAVRPDLVRRLADAAPAAEVTIVYGATEAEPISTIDADAYLACLATASPDAGICLGAPAGGTGVSIAPIASAAGREVGGSPVGRILVRGPHVVVAAPAGDGWHDTGDVGRLDDAGRVWWIGRAAHAIGDGRFAEEVERAAEAVPGIARAAAVRTSGNANGLIVLVAQPDGTRDASDALPRLQARLRAEGWRIDDVVVHDIPLDRRTGTKVDRRAAARLSVRLTTRRRGASRS
jgi:acyl-CoA synthetase (AMP-forming)/AMP-acid ligase II